MRLLPGKLLPMALLIVAGVTAATAEESTEKQSAEAERIAAWRADLELLATELPQRHPDLYHDLEERDLRAGLERLSALVPYADADRFKVELQKLLVTIGESHTALEGWYWMFPSAPIGLLLFPDGLYVGAATEADRAAVGGRVTRLGKMDVDEALDTLLAVVPGDNDVGRRSRLAHLARMPRLCSLLGIGCSADCLPLTVALPDGSTGEHEVCVDPDTQGKIVRAPDSRLVELPVSRQHRPGRIYWSAQVDRTLYVRYDECRNDEDEPFAEFAANLLAQVDEQEIERFVLDLRANSGGDSAVARPLLDGLIGHPTLDRPGRLFVLVGPETVSSAFMNALELSLHSNALLVGGTMGQRPNHYGELATLELPGSGLRVQHSTKLHRMIEDDDPEAIHPDIAVELRSTDYFAGRDPVFEAVLTYSVKDAE